MFPNGSRTGANSGKRLILLTPRGFCAGVVRAIDVVKIALQLYPHPIYVRKEIVHNRHVVDDLRQAGGQETQQNQLPTGLQLGTGVRPVATARLFTQGNLQQTGNTFDMAVNGNGFFSIQLPDGNVAYTRDGSFRVDSTGQLVTSNGMPMSPPIVTCAVKGVFDS